MWITMNEPLISAWFGHGVGFMAPGIKDPWNTMFTVGHHFILAHAKTYRLYDESFRQKQKGLVENHHVN